MYFARNGTIMRKYQLFGQELRNMVSQSLHLTNMPDKVKHLDTVSFGVLNPNELQNLRLLQRKLKVLLLRTLIKSKDWSQLLNFLYRKAIG